MKDLCVVIDKFDTVFCYANTSKVTVPHRLELLRLFCEPVVMCRINIGAVNFLFKILRFSFGVEVLDDNVVRLMKLSIFLGLLHTVETPRS